MKRELLAAVSAAALLLSACSSEQKAPEGGQQSPAPSVASHGSLAECLKSHGVEESGGTPAVLGPPAGVDAGTWNEAMKACSTLAPGPAGP
ncbi:MAG: hypothetical protein ACR2JM_07270 [Mycobacterium sp.]